MKRIVDEASAKVSYAEEKVQDASELVDKLSGISPEAGAAGGDGAQSPEAAQAARNTAQMALKGVTRYLEAQTRSGKLPREEILKLTARVKEAQQKIDSLASAMQAGSEKAAARSLIQEVEQRVKEAEDSMQRASVVAAPFLAEEEGDGESASEALAQLRDAVYAGGKALGSAKTFLAVKKIAAKRFAEVVARTRDEPGGTRLDAEPPRRGGQDPR